MFITKLLKFNIVSLLFLTRLFGFWPYFYNKCTRSYVTKWYLLLFPVVAMFGYVCAIMYSAIIIIADQQQQFKTFAANLSQYVYLTTSYMVYFSAYIIQYFKFSNLQSLIPRVQKCLHKITLIITNQQHNSNYTDLTIRFTIKFALVIIITVFCQYSQIDFYTKVGTNNVVLKACTTLPVFIFCILPNVFYAGILLACYYYRQLNNLITEVVKSSIQIGMTEKHRQYHMARFCALSDRLDEISVLHMELSCLTKLWNLLFTFPIFIWICFKSAFVIVSMFMIYIGIRDWLISKDDQRLENQVEFTFYLGMQVLMAALELFLVTNGCFNVEFEVLILYLILFIKFLIN